jgi:hypothetical protein
MGIDTRELNELTRKATELMTETADVPRVLRNQFGELHKLTEAAQEMLVDVETLVRELRCFDASAEMVAVDRFGDS